MAANETTPLLGETSDGPSTAAPVATSPDTESQQNESQQSFQDPIELKLAAFAHLNSVIDSSVSGALALVYGPLSHRPPKYYYPPWSISDLAQASVVLGIFTIMWGLVNPLLLHFRRRLLGPTTLSFLIHGVLALLTLSLFLRVLDQLMTEGGHHCQRWDGQQLYPADPRCLAWIKRFFTLIHVAMAFFLGVCISHVVLVYFYFVWTWRQLVSFVRSLPWARPEVSAQNGDYHARVPVSIVPTGGISFEFSIKFWGRNSVRRLHTETDVTRQPPIGPDRNQEPS
ncbi:hypothetical protein QBC36DRAFT_303042 [Triangularia setosa]|uniref:Uncharacterized protein n=1 Tax=Triangularia setosa TaxID=2587417 RepID=A0AAN6W3F2_9PEZI|nr:hypothetical protein QBC36DRAFT_303042 [Podospora setosa]